MIKDAYSRGGLKVINNGDTYTIAGSYWVIEVYRDVLTKKEKAAIIELTGDLPEKGEGFSSTKEGNQYEITENRLLRVMEDARETEKWMTQTLLFMKMTGGKIVNILQDPATGKIKMIDQFITSSVSDDAIDDLNGECNLEGPLLGPVGDVIWRNNWMALRVFGFTTEERTNHGANLAKLERERWA